MAVRRKNPREKYEKVLNVPLPKRPQREEIPEVPKRLTELPDKTLMALYTELVRWENYCGTQLAIAEIEEESTETNLKSQEAIALVKSSADSVTEAKADSFLNEEVTEAREKYMKAHAYKKLLKSVFEATGRKTQLVSRELTRRVGLESHNRRHDRWTP